MSYLEISGVPTWKYILGANIGGVLMLGLFPMLVNSILPEYRMTFIQTWPMYAGILTVACGISGTILLIQHQFYFTKLKRDI